MRTVLDGLVFAESARWRDRRLWLCDWGTGEVLALDPTGDRPAVEVVARLDTFPLSIDWTADGALLAVAGGDARVVRLGRGHAGGPDVLADLAGLGGGRWNEIAGHPGGHVYVNGGPGVVALVSDGRAETVADGLAFPNGMAVTADGSTLLVAESHAGRISAFTIGADGRLSGRRVWAAVDGSAPDGICLDADGALWYADVPNRRCVRVREGGEVLAVVDVDRGCFSCTLDDDPVAPTLYAVATHWRGMDAMFTGEPSGVVLAVPAPAPAARRPR